MHALQYTETEKRLFSGRTDYLKILKNNIKENKHSCILAPQGYGKKTLLKELLENISKTERSLLPIFLDLEKAYMSPEQFALEFVSAICSTKYKQVGADTASLLDLKLNDDCHELIKIIDNELQKIKPDQRLILETAFQFPSKLSAHMNKKLLIILNASEELLNLNNYSQIKDITQLFKESTEQENTTYILTAKTSLMKKRFSSFDLLELGAFSEEETSELVENILGKTDLRVKKEIHKLSAGIPFVVKALSKTVKRNSRKRLPISQQLGIVRKSFIYELSFKHSRTFSYCSSLFYWSLNNARGSSLLKNLAKIIATHDDLKLSEISRLLFRSAPVTKSLLARLIEVNLIDKQDSTFSFTNPVLKQWCILMFDSIEFEEEPELDDGLIGLFQKIGGRT